MDIFHGQPLNMHLFLFPGGIKLWGPSYIPPRGFPIADFQNFALSLRNLDLFLLELIFGGLVHLYSIYYRDLPWDFDGFR